MNWTAWRWECILCFACTIRNVNTTDGIFTWAKSISTTITLYYVLKKLYKFDIVKKFLRNPKTASLENCKLEIKYAASSELGLEEITRLEKDIKKWEKEKRELLLFHIEQLKKSEANL